MPKNPNKPPNPLQQLEQIYQEYPRAEKDKNLQKYHKQYMDLQEKMFNIADPMEKSKLEQHQDKISRLIAIRLERKKIIWDMRKNKKAKAEAQATAFASPDPFYLDGPHESGNKKGDKVVTFVIYNTPKEISKALGTWMEKGYVLATPPTYRPNLNQVTYTLVLKEEEKKK